MAQIGKGTRHACDLLYLGPNPRNPLHLTHTNLVPLLVRTKPRAARMYRERGRLYTCARLPL